MSILNIIFSVSILGIIIVATLAPKEGNAETLDGRGNSAVVVLQADA